MLADIRSQVNMTVAVVKELPRCRDEAAHCLELVKLGLCQSETRLMMHHCQVS